MNKWRIIILGIIIGFVIVLTDFFFARQRKIISPVSEEALLTETAQKLPSESLKEYQNDSGFKFSYPADLIISAKEIPQNVYANLEITSPEASGSISLKVTDSKFKSLDEWFLENKEATTSFEVKEIKLADITAKEVKKEDKIFTIALDQEALFTIEVNPANEREFWDRVYRTLISTFVFALEENGQTKEPPPPAAGDEIIFEGEEIIE